MERCNISKITLIRLAFLLALLTSNVKARRWAPGIAHNTPSTNSLISSSHSHTPKYHRREPWNKIQEVRALARKNVKVPAAVEVATLTISQRLIAGGCSRGIAQMAMYPMDALRTLAQTRDGRTLADVGAKALVRGCATTSSFAILIGSVQFAIFGVTREACGPVLSSALGAAGSCLVSVPQEVIKQRLVTGVYPNFRNAVSTIFKTEGIRGFYSAWRPTVVRNVPFVIATFTTMDYLKQSRLESKRRSHGNVDSEKVSLTFAENLLIGISSSLVGATITHPADVIKTRMMTQAASKALPYSSTIDCVQTIWKTEGMKSFYSGFPQRSVYMGPLWAIQFALNGKFSAVFKNQNLKKGVNIVFGDNQ